MNKYMGHPNMTPQEHHDCKGKYPSWETSSDKGRGISWCYGCNRTWYQDTGEETHLLDRSLSEQEEGE